MKSTAAANSHALPTTIATFITGFLANLFGTRRRAGNDIRSEFVPGVVVPRDCVLVLDASGSMDMDDWPPTRLDAAKDAAKAFVQRLADEQPDARVGIVAYGTYSQFTRGLTEASRTWAINKAIDSIRDLGATNITAGLRTALQALGRPAGQCQVVLLTDGHHNEGVGPEKVARKLREIAVLESVGIGGRPRDVDERLLKDISSAYPDGSKRYHWIGDRKQLVQHFHKLAGGLKRE